MATTKVIEGLDCEADAREGIRLILQARFGEMCDLRASALNWNDIEGVHDMRVASRRLRSALRDFDDFLDGKSIPQRRLKEVANALGGVRDEDVAIAALEKVQAGEGEEVAAGIEQLANERRERRERAREKLEGIINGTTLAGLQQKFPARLEKIGAVVEGKNTGKRGHNNKRTLSLRQAGREIVMARLAELQDLSNSLYHPFEIEPLHRMRIAAKRLRYAIDLFAPCWGNKISSCAREVAQLQTSLGELHDCDLWIADIGARLDRRRDRDAHAVTQPDSQAQVRQAAIRLLLHFTKERDKNFRRAFTCWQKWETTGFFERLTSLLDEDHTPSLIPPQH